MAQACVLETTRPSLRQSSANPRRLAHLALGCCPVMNIPDGAQPASQVRQERERSPATRRPEGTSFSVVFAKD